MSPVEDILMFYVHGDIAGLSWNVHVIEMKSDYICKVVSILRGDSNKVATVQKGCWVHNKFWDITSTNNVDLLEGFISTLPECDLTEFHKWSV